MRGRRSRGVLQADFEAIVSQPDIRRKQRFVPGVQQIVADVGEEGAARMEQIHRADRLRDRGMSGVRLVTQRVEEERIETAEEIQGSLGDLAMIG